jgi:serine/threonine-protein kinase
MIGTELEGRYRIEAELGSGGAGTVYRAVHLKLGRMVAIKMLKPEYGGSPELRQRFEREARALAALSHPNIVAVTDSGTAGDTLYLVMELLEGESLSERLKRGPLEPDEALAILGQLLLALSFVHERGLVHRDVKPGNVFLQNVPGGGVQVRLLDFGLAKFIAPEAGGRVLTRAGQIFGTPTYMAPEQVAGQEADVRADVYAAGIILFEMLTGKPPFRGNWSELMRQHLMEELPPIESVVPDRVPSRELVALLAKATAKTRAERFANAAELARALAELPRPVTRPASASGSEPTHLDAHTASTRVELPDPKSGAAHDAPAPPAPAAGGEAGGELEKDDAPADAPLHIPEEGAGGAIARFGRGVVRLFYVLLVCTSLAALGAAAFAVYVYTTPERAKERRMIEDALHLAPAGSARGASASATPAADETAPVPEAVAPSETGAATAAAAVEAASAAAPPAPKQDAGATATSGAAASATAPPSPPPAPLGPAPDPWASIPRDLAKLFSRVNHGKGLEKKEILSIHQYNAKHPDDPRGHLVLARGYLNRKWLKDSANEYAIAYKVDAGARGDPRMVRDLVSLVSYGSAEAERLVREIYGEAALPAIDKALAGPHPTPEAKARLERFRAELRG